MSLNKSEEKLGGLTKKTFLSMWSYENPFYKQGKELCDVLVVFGEDVIIISDKYNQFGVHQDIYTNWSRWHKKAVEASVKQLSGAKKYLLQSGKVWIDGKVSAPLPLRLPAPDKMRIHLLAVANGCEDACELHIGRRSLSINTQRSTKRDLFAVGIATEKDDFVHVISMPALEAMFACFDTASDFIEYLKRKKSVLTDQNWLIEGEENLIAAYMTSQPGNSHFFIPVNNFEIDSKCNARHVLNGLWSTYISSRQYAARIAAWEKSYVIDQIINDVAEDYLEGRMVIGHDQSMSYHEAAFRYLAGESRLSRQALAGALIDIYQESTKTFWSANCASLDNEKIRYLWLLYPQPPENISIEDLEIFLDETLAKYLLVAQSIYRDAEIIFGICLPNRDCEFNSRIFRVLDCTHWTPDMAKNAKYFMEQEGILKSISAEILGAVR